jgi:hypothetical protein
VDRRFILGKIGGYRSAAQQAEGRAAYCEQQGDEMGALIWRAKADAWRVKAKKWEEKLDALEWD